MFVSKTSSNFGNIRIRIDGRKLLPEKNTQRQRERERARERERESERE